jgi:xanthine/uracil permease
MIAILAFVAIVVAALIACAIWLSPVFAAVCTVAIVALLGVALYWSERANIARQRRHRGAIDLDEE